MINDMEHRLAFATIDATTLAGDDSFLVVNFPTQSDQSPFRQPWGISTISKYAPYSKRIRSLDGVLNRQGSTSFEMVFAVLTPEMFAYLESQFGGKETVDVTVQIPIKLKTLDTTWVCFNGKMDLPDRRGLTLEGGVYYTNVPFMVNKAVVSAEAYSFDTGYSTGFFA